MEKIFTTLDVWLSGFLSLHGIEARLEDHDGKIVFIFEVTDEFYRLMNAYNHNEMVPVTQYAQSVKVLRGKLLSLKDGHRRDENGYNKT